MIGAFAYSGQSTEIRIRKVANGFLVTTEENTESPEAKMTERLYNAISAQMRGPDESWKEADSQLSIPVMPKSMIKIPVERVYLDVATVLAAIEKALNKE